MTAPQSLLASELGMVSAATIREVAAKTLSGRTITSYAETSSPLSWPLVQEAGWDQVGIVEDGDGATLRDLVEIAQAWGNHCVPLPFVVSMMAKRHNAAARDIAGPVTFGLRVQGLAATGAIAPFGQVPGIGFAAALGTGEDRLAATDFGPDDEYAPTLRLAQVPTVTRLGPGVARELATVWAAESAGIAATLLADAVTYARQRHQFGRPIGSFQAIKHRLANALSDVEQAQTAAIWASHDEFGWPRATTHAAALSIRVAETAIQVHGGLGFTWEMGIHYYLRHLLVLRDLITGLAR